jgi:putative phosphoesterase
MQIGLISDIHGNLPALETVLSDMPPVDEIVCVGDVIGYNPWPAECVERIRDVAALTVQGNHDRTVRSPETYRSNQMAYAGLEYAQEELSEDQLRWLDNLPRKKPIADGRLLIVHDHPEIQDRYVLPHMFSGLWSYLDGYDGLALGHTHVQHKEIDGDRLLVNPGSVGQPRDDDPRAAYAVLDTETSSVELHRVAYDIDRVITEVEKVGLPTQIGTRLLDGS